MQNDSGSPGCRSRCDLTRSCSLEFACGSAAFPFGADASACCLKMPCRSRPLVAPPFFSSMLARLNCEALTPCEPLLSYWALFAVMNDIMLRFFAGGGLVLFLYTAKPELFNTLFVGGSGSWNSLSRSLFVPAGPDGGSVDDASDWSPFSRFILTVTPPLLCDGFTFLFFEGAGAGGWEAVVRACGARDDGAPPPLPDASFPFGILCVISES